MTRHLLTRRNLLKGCAVGTGTALVSSVPADQLAASERNRPNIILSVADDHGRGDLGCYGNPVIRTPNIDKLAGEGVRFTNAFCTTASCSASRSVILSGLYSHFNGQYGHQHDYHHFSSFDRVRSLPVLLSQGGYRTARIGKYHVAPDEIYRFDAGLQGNDRNAVQMADNCAKFFEAGSRARAAGILPANQGRDALAMEQPFFLYFSASDPHEVRNLADDPQHKDTPDRKKAKLKAFQKQTKDPWVLKWEYE